MEKYVKQLNGITYKDWQDLKNAVDNMFTEIKYQSILNFDEDTSTKSN